MLSQNTSFSRTLSILIVVFIASMRASSSVLLLMGIRLLFPVSCLVEVLMLWSMAIIGRLPMERFISGHCSSFSYSRIRYLRRHATLMTTKLSHVRRAGFVLVVFRGNSTTICVEVPTVINYGFSTVCPNTFPKQKHLLAIG